MDEKNKLFVGNLSFSTTGDALREAFAAAGAVTSATVLTDRETGRSRGFGFVEMATPEEAQNAIAMFDGKDMDGRPLRVNLAEPKQASNGPRDFNNNRGGSRY